MASPVKVTNRIRLSVCVLYVIQIFLLTETFFVMNLKGSKITDWSVITLLYTSVDSAVFNFAAVLFVVCLVPIAGFFFFCFDKKRNIKNIYGIVTSAIAVFLITAMIPADSLGIGAVFSMLLYLPIVFLSVLGMFARRNQLYYEKS